MYAQPLTTYTHPTLRNLRALALSEVAGASAPGPRDENQDWWGVRPDLGLAIVCDGVGGRGGGREASRLAGEIIQARLETLGTDLGELCDTDALAALRWAVRAAGREIFRRSATSPELAGMATTVTALLVTRHCAAYAHVGDSRLYRYRDGTLAQVTDDHTLVASLVRQGLLPHHRAATHPMRHVITRALGNGPLVEIDGGLLRPRAGDRFLLCTDGITGVLPDEALARLLGRRHRDPANRLVKLSLRRDTTDNTTAVVVDLEERTLASMAS